MTTSGSGKRRRRPGAGAGTATERKFDNGWAAAPGVRVRQAVPADVDAVRELATLAGTTLDDVLAGSVASGAAGLALRAGLSGGMEGFNRHIAERLIACPDDPLQAYLSAALVLVADDREHGVVGTVVAYPPANLVQLHLDGARRRGITDPRELNKLMMLGAVGLAKIKALAVAEPARGRNVGGSLLLRCRQVFFACGYVILYGQMPAVPGLDAFYRRNGFEVLATGKGWTCGRSSGSIPASTLTRASGSSSATARMAESVEAPGQAAVPWPGRMSAAAGTLRAMHDLPEDPQTLYQAWKGHWPFRQWLYVGITNSPSRRFGEQRRSSEWMLEAGTIRLARFPDRESVIEAERRMIRAKRPQYNVQHNRHEEVEVELSAENLAAAAPRPACQSWRSGGLPTSPRSGGSSGQARRAGRRSSCRPDATFRSPSRR